MYAIIQAGGRQYRVEQDDVLTVEKLAAEPGETITFEQIALVESRGKARVGTPWVKGAKVTCRVLEHGRGRKFDVFTFNSKENTKRKLGHRQPHTRIRIEKITAGRSRSTKET